MRRSVVTGIGVVAPGGVSRDKFWEAITAGRTATRKITFFDPSGFRSQIAAECDFDPRAAGLSDQETRRMDRYIQFAVASAIEAFKDSGLDLANVDHDRMGVSMGSAVGALCTWKAITWRAAIAGKNGSWIRITPRRSRTRR